MTWKIKENVNLEILVSKYNFISISDFYIRCGKKRNILINKQNREIDVYKKDSTTYTGYAYSNEYRHNTRYYIKDLIQDGLVEVIK